MKFLILLFTLVALAFVLQDWAKGFRPFAARDRVNAILTFAFHAPLGFVNAFRLPDQKLALANLAEGVHQDGKVTYKADAALATRYLLVKSGSDENHIAVCAAANKPLGVATDEPAAAEDLVNVNLLGSGSSETQRMVASEAIAVDAYVFTAAGGKIQDEPAAAGTYYLVGKALKAAAADGDVIEVDPIPPIKLVVIAALTSTDGTAAAAADLAALKAEAEKIGDDVRAIAAALATTSLVKVLAA